MSEARVQSEVLRAIGALPNVRVFRNQVGFGWVGRVAFQDRTRGIVNLVHAQPVTMGLATGSSDLVGWRRRIITPDMVGQEIAQFICVEVKTPKGAVREAQQHWREVVNRWGGLALVVRSADEALTALKP